LNRFFTYLLFTVSLVSCIKDNKVVVADQAALENERIVKYLSTHKLDSLPEVPNNLIHWEITEMLDSDHDSLSLINLAVVDSLLHSGYYHRYYYVEVEEGSAIESGVSKDLMVIDYNEFTLDNNLTVSSNSKDDAVEVEIESRNKGLKAALDYFFTGEVEEVLGLHYRTNTVGPGKGIIFLPSGLAYGEDGSPTVKPNTPIRIDLILYHKMDRPDDN
jgi:hypothetical protein